jgi:L,D-transpeptidase ErfK/SrfK
LLAQPLFAITFDLPANGDTVVGNVQVIQSEPGDNFTTIGERYDIGYVELEEANPSVDPQLPQPGTVVVIPSRFVLPNTPHTGIVINQAELRLYYYPPNSHKVITFPVGIGREGWSTPIGVTTITAKVKDPTWYVPEGIRKARAEEGVELPISVPPGPDNPLGAYAMRLGFPSYLIHSTNDPSGVGRRSSSGCIRMFPEDVEWLFPQIATGTQVTIINTPYKAGWEYGKLYLEAHIPLQEQQAIFGDSLQPMMNIVNTAVHQHNIHINWETARKIAETQNGIPQVIGESRPALASNV